MKEPNAMTGAGTNKIAAKRKGKRKMWIIPVVIVGLLAVGVGVALAFAQTGLREVNELTIDDVSFQNLRDGSYVGQYTGVKDHMRDTKVQVTVEAGKVSGIQALNTAMFKDGKPVEMRNGLTIDDLFGKVIDQQSLQVDVISGATLTSKTHLKAVEDAVEQAQKK